MNHWEMVVKKPLEFLVLVAFVGDSLTLQRVSYLTETLLYVVTDVRES